MILETCWNALGNAAGKPHDPESQAQTLELALKVLESAPGPRTTVQSPQRWSESGEWKLDFSNVERLSPEEITRRLASRSGWTLVDGKLDELAAAGDAQGRAAAALRGRAAIASARCAYVAFEEVIASPRFQRVRERGAVRGGARGGEGGRRGGSLSGGVGG